MTLQLNISYNDLLELVKQLDISQKHDLITHLSEETEKKQMSVAERKALYHSSILSVPLKEIPSVRREDWYGDDGR